MMNDKELNKDFNDKTLFEMQRLASDFNNLSHDELRMLMSVCDYVKAMCVDKMN